MNVYQRVMRAVGDEFGGNDAPPFAKTLRYRMDGRKLRRVAETGSDTQIITSNNDGFELWFGWGDRWNHHMSQGEARALFWWLLWEWFARARWFGIRRPIYYWALRHHVASFRAQSPAQESEKERS